MRTEVAACIPFKDLASSKSRLSNLLAKEARQCFALKTLIHVIRILTQSPQISWIRIFCPDYEVMRKMPPELQSLFLLDLNHLDLNCAFTYMTQLAEKAGFGSLLFLHGDLPFLCPTDIAWLLDGWAGETVCLISDDKDSGTNGILTPLPALLKPAFGKGSLSKHIARCNENEIRYEVIKRPGLSIDIDDQTDYLHYINIDEELR